MRTPKELFEVLRDNRELFKAGLCAYITSLYWKDLLSGMEADFLENYLLINKPLIAKIRRKLLKFPNNRFYWKFGAWKPRLRWINRQIKKFS